LKTRNQHAIRTYAETAAAMRRAGDATITTSHIHYYEQAAFRKLRKALATLEAELLMPEVGTSGRRKLKGTMSQL